MRIAWYDHGHIHQSAAIPDLPTSDEALFVFSDGVNHLRPNVIGCEMWRIPVLHQLIDDGHEIVWLTRRDIMPSADHDFDLQRLVDMEPQYAPFVREKDPMLDCELWAIRQELNTLYFADLDKLRAEGVEDPTGPMFDRWIKDSVFGYPPEVDVAVIAAMRANVATGFETGYCILKYLEMGIPVIIYDQDRQMAGTVASFRRTETPWPHPLVTLIGPYDAEPKHGKPILIDYPYVAKFEKDPIPVAEKEGCVYVGNDYDRRKAMERLMMHLPESASCDVHVWGKYDSDDAERWKALFPRVDWAGRCPSARVPNIVNRAHFTTNIVKENYMKIGLLTLRTFDTNVYGSLQIGDSKVRRLSTYVPVDYLVETPDQSARLARKILEYSDDQYAEELERQRSMTRKNDLDHYMERLYDVFDIALQKAGRTLAEATAT